LLASPKFDRLMKLCEQGVLDLDTALTKYTPDIFLKGDPKLEPITARRVLSHNHGFSELAREGRSIEY